MDHQPISAELELRLFNVDEYYRLGEVGILDPDERVELIDGKIVKLEKISPPHAACVTRSVERLREAIGKTAMLRTQNPVRLNELSEPVPDVAMVEYRKNYYWDRHPNPEDTLMIIEVADLSLLKDRDIKVPLYARSGIPEVWLVNLIEQIIEVYSDALNGEYRQCRKVKRGETVVSPGVEGLSLQVEELLG